MTLLSRACVSLYKYFIETMSVCVLSRACVSLYKYFIETMSVCRTVSEILSIKEWHDNETGGRGRSWSLKMVPFDRLQCI